MATKIKALQMWCRKMTEGYANVDIANFTTSWRDGMAFCALIHRFRPDLIDFEALSSENVYDNCKMAFEIAEKELNIPAFLEADDMARLKVPDKLSVITYVSQYYNYLHALPQLGGPGVREKVSTKVTSGVKRPPDGDTSQAPTSKKSTTDATKENEKSTPDKSLSGSLGDRCGICRNKVYLLERHIEGGKLYHRSCFRHSELSPTSKVYTRSPFMSPSLSTETPPSPAHLTSEVRAGVGDTLEQKAPNVHQNVSNSRAEPSVLKKNELAGMKHSLTEPDREDSKKSKIQAKSAAVIKQKLESLKAKYTTETNDKVSEKSFPLSSKEAHRLDKRKAEILSAEKTVEAASKGNKRNVPLIFQQKEVESSSSVQAKSISSASTSKIPTSPSSGNHTTGATSSVFKSTAPTTSAKVTLATDQDHEVSAKERLASEKAKPDPHTKENKLNTVGKKDTFISDLSNARSKLASFEASKSSTPTAKPRGNAAKLVADVSSSQHTEDSTSSKYSQPKPAPRKTVAQTPEKKSAPERPKDLPTVKHPTELVSKTTPSPLSPPPLPSSQPPPFSLTSPASTSSGEVSASMHENQKSKVSKAEWKIQELKSSPPAEIPKDNIITHTGFQKATTPEKEQHSKGSKDPTIKPSILKSSVTLEISKDLGNKDTVKGSDRRWSTPPSSDPEPLAVFVNPVDKDNSEQVRSGLLASLTGVRARTMSVPGSTSQPLSISSPRPGDTSTKPDNLVTSKSSITIKGSGSGADHPKGPHVFLTPTKQPDKSSDQKHKKDLYNISSSKVTEKESSVKHNTANTPASKQIEQRPEALNILSSLKHIDASQSATVKTEITLSSQKEDKQKTKAPQIVGIFKNGSKKDTEQEAGASSAKLKDGTLQLKDSDDNTGKHKPLDNVKISTKSSSKDSEISAVLNKGGNVSNNTVSVESKSSAPKKDDPLSLNNVKLKRVMPEKKVVTKETEPPLFDVKLKKVDDPPVKPARSKHEENSSKELSSTKVSNAAIDSVSVSVAATEGEKVKDNQSNAEDIPQWKKNIEDRKKKLREEMAKSDLSSIRSKYTKDKTERPKSADVSDLMKEDESDVVASQASSKVNSPRRKSFDLLESRKEEEQSWEQILEAKAKLSKPRRTPGSEQQTSVKLEWQIEAEKRMAAIAAIDKDNHKKQSAKQNNSSDPGSSVSLHVLSQAPAAAPTQVSKPQTLTGITEETESTKSKSELDIKPKGEVRKDSKMTVEIKKETNGSTKHVDTVTPTRGVDFIVSKSMLRPLQIKFDDSQTVRKDTGTGLPENKTPTDENGGMEDFREKLRQLKHVDKETAGEAKHRLPSDTDSGQSGTTSKQTVKTSLTFNNLKNNHNNNNNEDDVEKALYEAQDEKKDTVSDKDHITKLQEKAQSVFKIFRLSSKEKKSKEQENGSLLIDDSLEKKVTSKTKEEVKSASPKVMRKISVLGRNKKGKIDSPPQSPSPLKKIEVSTKFDFENSLDLSLTENTAKMTLQDTRTPPPRPPPPHEKAKSPGHISAIELQQQLLDIDSRLTELELRGRDLEDSLRKVNAHEDEDDELMKEWFGLVSEKNELVRREADLVYFTREQDLENEQDQIEAQLRYLISKPDECKSPAEKTEESYLIDRKIELVEQRNLIVTCMDEDRLRYIEEDRNIEVMLRGKAGLWKNESGTLKALHGKKVAKSKFYT